MAQWIWYYGEYEIYHNKLLHARRQEYGADYPCFWQLPNVYPRVNFYKSFDAEKEGSLLLHVFGKGYVLVDGVRYPAEVTVPISKGHHSLEVVTVNTEAFPAIYVESDLAPSDGTWFATPGTKPLIAETSPDGKTNCYPVGHLPVYEKLESDLTVFPFERENIIPSAKTVEGGKTVYDFGREMFGTVSFRTEAESRITVSYGESYEEAISYGKGPKHDPLVYETVSGKTSYTLTSRAFRYIAFEGGEVSAVTATLELLPVRYRGSFSCDDPMVERVYRTSAYTFHLCMREFFLDGIKRDRWCWSGDAYLSYIINAYLFDDNETTKRTMLALYGKPPYEEHINTINDYSALLIIGTWEYVFRSGDIDFLRFLWEKVKGLYAFIVGRLREDGYVVGRPGDWVFIDWSEIDKTGAVAAEQILLWQVANAMAGMAALLGEGTEEYVARADALKRAIDRDFWSEEKGAYIDSFESGKAHVSRHANIFALLFDFCDAERAETVCRRVLENDEITRITTPYFEAYELMALCKMGRMEAAQSMITSYWGGMLALGATSIWEEYDPTLKGAEHYAMYGSDYGKSLCHAWGAGPVCFLGRYCAGVEATSLGSATFTVTPRPGNYRTFTATVPMRDGEIKVEYRDGSVSVITELSGGTLCYGGKSIPILPGKVNTITE